MRRVALTLAAAAIGLAGGGADAAEAPAAPARAWSFEGIFGTFDRAAQRRGFEVYSQVCSACHALSFLAYRNLEGIGFTEDEIKAIAAEREVTDGPDDAGEMFQRPARASDPFVSPFANDQAARAANNGALPPDLSLIVKARANGANYLHALLVGYGEPPADVTVPDGMYYNAYFLGHQIAMPPPLSEGAVEYADGTPATVEQMAEDVTVFLSWAAEPETEARKRMGVKALLFLIVFTGMLYAVKRKVWTNLH